MPFAFCLLPFAFCLLPFAFCLAKANFKCVLAYECVREASALPNRLS
ncbi:hypothetical protein [Moorena sp. SIO4G3]|nr:hypothetical protein [Moorena sp. SIO4G3]NEO76290.1 hypothetical protein [Moorena sp. SIO4G3]